PQIQGLTPSPTLWYFRPGPTAPAVFLPVLLSEGGALLATPEPKRPLSSRRTSFAAGCGTIASRWGPRVRAHSFGANLGCVSRPLLHSSPSPMNLTDRIYLAVHIALTILVCARFTHVAHGPWYVAWNALAISAIMFLARNSHHGTLWEFAHDWLPVVFFVTVF